MHYYSPPKNKTVHLMSDPHAFHKNIAYGSSVWPEKRGTRPFDNEVIMTEVIADNINKVVMPQDVLITLGDWSFGGVENIRRFREMINCNTIITLLGNHDHHSDKQEFRYCFERILQYNECRVGKQLLVMMHYPILSWNEIGRGSIMAFGHCHGNLPKSLVKGRMKDMSMECINYTPQELGSFIDEMNRIPIGIVDHHGTAPHN